MRGWWRFVRCGALAAAIVCACASVACGAFAAQPTPIPLTPGPNGNVLQNAGFENGPEPWTRLDTPDYLPFTVADSFGHDSAHSLKLEMHAGEADTATEIAGAYQRIEGGEFPEFVSGYYYIEEWAPVEPVQYLQFVVNVHGGNHPDGQDVHSVRFLLGGAEGDPYSLTSGAFVFLDRGEPTVREWTYFSYPIRDALRSRFSWDPVAWDTIDVFFEVRYDRKETGTAGEAVVYYDDLYVGPQVLNPNRPPEEDGG